MLIKKAYKNFDFYSLLFITRKYVYKQATHRHTDKVERKLYNSLKSPNYRIEID